MGWGLEYRDGGRASSKIVVFPGGSPSRHYTNVVAERAKKRIIRPELVEAIWDTIPENAGTDVLPLSEEHRAELERRLADMELIPASADLGTRSGLGAEFRAAIDALFARLLDTPNAWTRVKRSGAHFYGIAERGAHSPVGRDGIPVFRERIGEAVTDDT